MEMLCFKGFPPSPSSGSTVIVEAEQLFRTLNLSSKLTQMIASVTFIAMQFVSGLLY
jgi:hypothetical protein